MPDVAEESRLHALRKLAILDTAPEERFDRVVRLAQQLFAVPMVAVNLVDADRQWTKAGIGIDGDTPRPASFCSHTIEQPGLLLVEDTLTDDRFRDNPLVTGNPTIRFYAGQPLRAPNGQRVGALCLVDDKPRDLSKTERRLLADLAAWVERELAVDEDLLAAGELQRRLLPQRPPEVPGYDVAGRCLMAREVGGDFFDWHFVDGRLQVTIADVMGKGVAAAIIAASVRSVLRGASRFNELEEAVTRAAFSLDDDLAETSTFVTAFSARLDPRNGVLQYVDAGHGLSAVLSPDGVTYRHLASDGLPLGAVHGDSWTAQVTLLQPGETLVSVSDGVLEFFDSPRHALDIALGWNAASESAQELVDLMSAMCAQGSLEDDVTVVAVRRAA